MDAQLFEKSEARFIPNEQIRSQIMLRHYVWGLGLGIGLGLGLVRRSATGPVHNCTA